MKRQLVALLFGVLSFSANSELAFSVDTSELTLNDGEIVSEWGGFISHGTPTYVSNSSLSGGGSVLFGGDDHLGSISIAPSESGDIIMAAVVKATNTGQYQGVIDSGSTSMLWVDPSFRYEANRSGGGGNNLASSGWDIIVFDSVSNTGYINGEAFTGGNSYSYTKIKSFDILNRGGAQTFQGLVSELRVYTDKDDIGGSLSNLYVDLSQKWDGAPLNLVANVVDEPRSSFLLLIFLFSFFVKRLN